MEEGNGKLNEHRLTKLEEGYRYLQEDIGYIKRQVDNHIPTQIKELDSKLDAFMIRSKVQSISILVSLLIILIGIIIDLAIHKFF